MRRRSRCPSPRRRAARRSAGGLVVEQPVGEQLISPWSWAMCRKAPTDGVSSGPASPRPAGPQNNNAGAVFIKLLRRTIRAMAGIPETLKGRSFTRVSDWSPDELGLALDLADELKVEDAFRRRELRILPVAPSASSSGSRQRGRGSAPRSGSPSSAEWRSVPSADLQLARGESTRDTAIVLALPERDPHPHVRPGGGGRVRRARDDPDRQRSHRRRTSAPGPRGRDGDPRALRPARRCPARVPR